MTIAGYIVLMIAAIPGIYYLLAIYSSIHYLEVSRRENPPNTDFFPPISCLKPIRGLDEDAYENYASFCRQDYPEYEIVFCVDPDDPALPVLEQLVRDFPERQIRLLFGSGRNAINDKIGRLTRLVAEAQYDLLDITDGDIRVGPDYLRAIAHPFRDPKVGGATTLYVSTEETSFVQELQSIGMISDFFAGIMTAWQLDGVKFMFGQSIVTTKQKIAGFGGYESIENRPADDLNVGRLVAEQAEVKLLPYIVKSVADFQSLQRFVLQARALDDGHAPGAAPGASRTHLYLGSDLGADCRRRSSHLAGGRWISRHVHRAARDYDVADRHPHHGTERPVAEDASDPAVGPGGVHDLGGQLWQEHDSLARFRLHHSRRNPGARQSRQDASWAVKFQVSSNGVTCGAYLAAPA